MDDARYVAEKQKNLFINFFIIKFTWKQYGKLVDDLYTVLKVNRSIFDRIYRLDNIAKLDGCAKDLADITGLDPSCFRGRKCIEVAGISRSTWEKFIDSTIKRRKQYNQQGYYSFPLSNQCEIEKYLTEAIRNPSKQPYTFRAINYFLKNETKQRDDKVENIIAEIEADITGLSFGDIQRLPPELFDKHRKTITDYAKKLDGLGVVNEWKSARK